VNQEKSDLEELKKNAGKLQRTLQHSLKDNLLYTIETIMDKVRERGIKGVYGQLIDLIKIKPELNVCCDIVLKNKLFGFVVDSYEVADLLIKINQEIKGSAINIYPLSWISELKPKAVEYPTGNDVIIVKNHIQPQEGLAIDIRPLIENIFGKVLLVRNYQTATVIAKKYRLNCVTSEGELVYAGSYLTKLGFYDVREESITMYLQYKGIKDNLDQVKVNIAKAEHDKDNLSNEDLQTTQRLHHLIVQKNSLTQSLMAAKAELRYLVNENLILEKVIKENEGYIKLYEEEIFGCNNKIEIYNHERDNPNLTVEGALTENEKTTLDQITTQVNNLKEEIRKNLRETVIKMKFDAHRAQHPRTWKNFNETEISQMVMKTTLNVFGIAGQRALYPNLCLFNHSCAPNTSLWYQENKILLLAQENIPKGQEVFVSYTSALENPEKRRKNLLSYGFECHCARCQGRDGWDQKELNLTGLKCPQCQTNVPIKDDKYQCPKGCWQITKKQSETAKTKVHDKLVKIHESLHEMQNINVKDLKEFLKDVEKEYPQYFVFRASALYSICKYYALMSNEKMFEKYYQEIVKIMEFFPYQELRLIFNSLLRDYFMNFGKDLTSEKLKDFENFGLPVDASVELWQRFKQGDGLDWFLPMMTIA